MNDEKYNDTEELDGVDPFEDPNDYDDSDDADFIPDDLRDLDPSDFLQKIEALTKDFKERTKNMTKKEARHLNDLYYTFQHYRIMTTQQTTEKDENNEGKKKDISDFGILLHFRSSIGTLEKQVETALFGYASNDPIGVWIMSHKGLKAVLASGLLAHLDVTDRPTAGHFLRFAGIDPEVKWIKKREVANDIIDSVTGKITPALISRMESELGVLPKNILEKIMETIPKKVIAAIKSHLGKNEDLTEPKFKEILQLAKDDSESKIGKVASAITENRVEMIYVAINRNGGAIRKTELADVLSSMTYIKRTYEIDEMFEDGDLTKKQYEKIESLEGVSITFDNDLRIKKEDVDAFSKKGTKFITLAQIDTLNDLLSKSTTGYLTIKDLYVDVNVDFKKFGDEQFNEISILISRSADYIKTKVGKVTKENLRKTIMTRPYNAKLKTLCWKIGGSFMMVQNRENSPYGELFKKRKAYEMEKNLNREYRKLARRRLGEVGSDTEAYKWYEKGMLPPKHIETRVRRYVAKIFLSHLHHVMYKLKYGVEPPKPYPIAIMGHAHFVPIPNLDLISAYKDLSDSIKL